MGSVSRPLSGLGRKIFNLKITPIYLVLGHRLTPERTAQRGVSPRERAARIAANPSRAAAIVKGRQRLAQVTKNRNPEWQSLSTLRLAAGLSQAELASMTDMKQPNIARLEKNPGDPSLSTLRKLAVALGVEITQVIAAVDAINKAKA